MTTTFVINPNQSIDDSPIHFIGASTDTKPTTASHSGLPPPTLGSDYWEYDTGDRYITYDKTNWSKVKNTQLVRVSRTKASVTGGLYSAKDVISEQTTNAANTSWIFTDVVAQNGAGGYIVKAVVVSETTNITPRISLFLYKAVPTCELDDNAASNCPLHADLDNYVGRLDFPALQASELGTNNDSAAQIVPGSYQGVPLAFACATADNDLYGVAVTWDAVTLGVGDDLTFFLMIERA